VGPEHWRDPVTSPTEKAPESRGWLPTLIAVLIVLNLAAVAYLSWAPAAAPEGGPAVPAPSSAPVGMVAPAGAPQAQRTPYLGPTPTNDAATWLFTPGDFLLGALRQLDRNPATALDAEQHRQLAAVLQDAVGPGKGLVEAEAGLSRIVRGALEAAQVQAIEANRQAVLDTPVDLDALVEGLKRKAGRVAPSGRPVSGPQPALPGTWLIAGLSWLEKSKTPLSSAQAGALLPFVSGYVRALREVAAIYPKAAALLKPDQRTAFVATLADMRSGTIDPNRVKMSLADMMTALKTR